MQPAQSQGSTGTDGCQPLATRTQFVPLASDKSKAVTHKSPSVGLQNTNNTCYMNSFVQGLFWRDAFLWRIHNFNLKLKNNPSKMDKEKYEIRKGGRASQQQFAKMVLMKQKLTDMWQWDILQTFPCRLSILDSSRMWQRLCALSLPSWAEVINNCWRRSLQVSPMRRQCKECGEVTFPHLLHCHLM